jgi:hypothetical protein
VLAQIDPSVATGAIPEGGERHLRVGRHLLGDIDLVVVDAGAVVPDFDEELALVSAAGANAVPQRPSRSRACWLLPVQWVGRGGRWAGSKQPCNFCGETKLAAEFSTA